MKEMEIKNIYVEINGRLHNINDVSPTIYKQFQKEASVFQQARIERQWREGLKTKK